MIVYIGADHRGFKLKQSLSEFLNAKGYDARDLGAVAYNPADDYPDFARLVAEKVSVNHGSRGIVICGSGGGVSIVANKYRGVRAVLGFSPTQAKATKLDEDTNVLAISSDFTSTELARDIADAWLKAEFTGEERYVRRLDKITEIENQA